ncbi:unnamed protein product [Effrenium voratum]|uniref:Uncharacterized protein n=1 Tax=Effrenium voratum TaxID=2562239 RepID=A0AA36JTZ1_9DINO|nr:unnamed protein product [Effrenium voratum]CAJ1458221.1 unnamed protein product [Effrenium voratum]
MAWLRQDDSHACLPRVTFTDQILRATMPGFFTSHSVSLHGPPAMQSFSKQKLTKGHLRLRAGVLAICVASSWGKEQTDIRKLSLMVLGFHRECHDHGLASAR